MEDRDFADTCEKLLRNDPSVVKATPYVAQLASSDSSVELNTNLHRYFVALKDNVVVTDFELDFETVLGDSSETVETIIERLQPLLHFLEHGPSLVKAALHRNTSFSFAVSVRMQILQLLVEAMSKNRSLRSFESHISYFSPELLTSFLSTKQNLQKLFIIVDVLDSSDEVVERSARAIGSHPTLEDLGLMTENFLPFLRSLQSHSTLRRLRLVQGDAEPDISLLPSVMESSRNLTEIAFDSLDIDVEQWRLVSTGIQSNPSISSLAFDMSGFSAEASELMLEDLQSNDALRQPIRKLSLSNSYFNEVGEDFLPYARIATMLCRSLLHHMILDRLNSELGDLQEFFESLSASASVVPLRTLELTGEFPGALGHAAVFLPTTVNLKRLKIKSRRLAVPTVFLSSLRCNGSLCSVEIKGRERRLTVSKRVKRYVHACTKRNRTIPKVMPTLFQIDKPKASNANSIPSPSNRFPTVSFSAMQAPLMAPNNVLIGLLASLETLVPPRERDGKRVAVQHT